MTLDAYSWELVDDWLRDKFPMLSDDEIEKIEGAYTEAFTVSMPSSRPK